MQLTLLTSRGSIPKYLAISTPCAPTSISPPLLVPSNLDYWTYSSLSLHTNPAFGPFPLHNIPLTLHDNWTVSGHGIYFFKWSDLVQADGWFFPTTLPMSFLSSSLTHATLNAVDDELGCYKKINRQIDTPFLLSLIVSECILWRANLELMQYNTSIQYTGTNSLQNGLCFLCYHWAHFSKTIHFETWQWVSGGVVVRDVRPFLVIQFWKVYQQECGKRHYSRGWSDA